MSMCNLCLRPHPTHQELRRERRRDRAWRLVEWLLIAVIASSVGYLLRDGVFLKAENGTLWSLLNTRVTVTQIDKLVDQNAALKAKVKAQRPRAEEGRR